MKVRFQIDKDAFGQEGIVFIDNNDDELYFIPKIHLCRIDYNHKVLDKFTIGDVLHQIVELSKKEWGTTELLCDLTKHIQKTSTEIDVNVFADTYRAINEYKKIKIIANNFLKDNPRHKFSIANSEEYRDWKHRLKKYISDNYDQKY